MNGPGTGHSGHTLIEALVGLLLIALLTGVAWKVVALQRRSAGELWLRAELLETERVVRTVLGREIRAGHPGRDALVFAGDSLSLRAFRGIGVVCPEDRGGGDMSLLVHYRGARQPDPAKDSILLLGHDGIWRAFRLEARAPGPDPCRFDPNLEWETWSLDPEGARGTLARVYERGSYHLSDASFRYRRGRGGRQPLTAPVLDPVGTGIAYGQGGSVVLDLGMKVATGAQIWTRRGIVWPREEEIEAASPR